MHQLHRLSLRGLAIGDALGKNLAFCNSFRADVDEVFALPEPPWTYTDDTIMAMSIVECLETHGRIVQDDLAERFASKFRAEPDRGYGSVAYWILSELARGNPWRGIASTVYDGAGSLGNGGAMRSAPLGAYFSSDLQTLAAEARLSAEVTHWHPDGQAGAVAVAAATALALSVMNGQEYLRSVADLTPEGPIKSGILRAASMLGSDPRHAGEILGLGQRIAAEDTVPFALWCVAEREGHFESSLRLALSVCLSQPDSDRDTIGAIVGGVSAVTGRGWEAAWASSLEALPGERM